MTQLTGMSENILSLGKLCAELLSEADEPCLGIASSAVKRSEVLTSSQVTIISPQKRDRDGTS